MKLAVAASLALLAGLAVAGAEESVKVGYPYTNAPFAWLPGATALNYATLDPAGTAATGAVIDLTRAIATDAGIQIQFVPMPVGDLIPALMSSKVDVLVRLQIPSGPQTVIDLSGPVDTDSEGLIVPKSDTTPYRSWGDLPGTAIAAVAGTAAVGPLARSGLFTEIWTYPSGSEMYEAISSGDIDAGIAASAVGAAYLLRQGQYPNLQLVKSYQPRLPVVTAIGVRKGASDLLRKIDASLQKLRVNGVAQAIYAKYGIDQYLALPR